MERWKRIGLLLPLLGLSLAQAQQEFPSEEEIRRLIQNFNSQYYPGAPGYAAPTQPLSCGADLLSLALQAYNIARNFFRGLPHIYLRAVESPETIRNRILSHGVTEITLVTGKVARLPQRLTDALYERVAFSGRNYPHITLSWSMPKDELGRYQGWKGRNPQGATVNLSGRGEDILTEVLGIPEGLGFGFMMLNNDIYLFNCAFFRVDPGPAGAFIPWIREVQRQITEGQRR